MGGDNGEGPGDGEVEAPPGPRKGPGRGQNARGVEMRRKVMEFRVGGQTFEMIGRLLGVSRQVAHRHYQRAIKEANGETGELVLESAELTRRRCDAIVAAQWSKRGDPRSADAILHAESIRMKVDGTEAAKKLELSGKGGKPIEVVHRFSLDLLTDEELSAYKALAMKAAARAAPTGDARPPFAA